MEGQVRKQRMTNNRQAEVLKLSRSFSLEF